MKLQSVIKAVGALCLLLADGFTVSGAGSPEIIGPHRIKVEAKPGELVFLHCEAFTTPGDMTLIYWLVNDSFPEDAVSDDRIAQPDELSLEDGSILQRSLLLKNVTSDDLGSTFTCVVMNAVGSARKHVTLTGNSRDCAARKERKLRLVFYWVKYNTQFTQ